MEHLMRFKYIPISHLVAVLCNSVVLVLTLLCFLEWIASGSNSAVANASSIVDDQLICLETQLQNPTPLSELDDFAQDSTGIFAIANVSSRPSIVLFAFLTCFNISLTKARIVQGVQWQIGDYTDVRGLGINGSGLRDTIDPTFSQHPQFS